jgi:hypothetical protein
MASPSTVKRRLRRLLRIWRLLPALGLFRVAFSEKIGFSDYFNNFRDLLDPGKVQIFASERWSTLILVAIFFYLYQACSAEQEFSVDTAHEVFSPDKVPTDWQKFLGGNVLEFVIVANIIQFSALAFTVDDLLRFTAVLLTFYSLSVIGNYTTGKTINTYFQNPVFEPSSNYPLTPFIKRRREVVLQFVNRWHPQKEIFVAFGCLLVLLLTYFELNHHRAIPYLALAALIASNEYIVWRWRFVRDKALDQINDDQDDFARRGEEERIADHSDAAYVQA